jgi:alpha-N-acetylglucosaminidase
MVLCLSACLPGCLPAPCSRNFGADAAKVFDLSLADPCGGKGPCFALSQSGGKVKIAASSMSELTYGIGYYTRYTCGLTVGRDKWGGSHTNASSWPCSSELEPVTVQRAVKYTYQDNVCTHSYSYVWYGEEEWTQHIDQMALSGINVRHKYLPPPRHTTAPLTCLAGVGNVQNCLSHAPLSQVFYAITGQEEIQYKAFKQFGLKDTEIREFFNGPAYLTWSRGQSMQTVGTGKSVNSE